MLQSNASLQRSAVCQFLCRKRLPFLQLWVAGGLFLVASLASAKEAATLDELIQWAQQHDPVILQSQLQQQVDEAHAIAAGTMPDPRVSFGLTNLPVDSFDLDQEPMTQITLGVSQQLPRGDSLSLRRSQLWARAQVQTAARRLQAHQVRRDVTLLWLTIYQQQQRLHLLDEQRMALQQLEKLAQASYRVHSGQARQQQVIAAKVARIRLDEKRASFQQQQARGVEQLKQWLVAQTSQASPFDVDHAPLTNPALRLSQQIGTERVDSLQAADYRTRLSKHPSIQLADQRVRSADKQVEVVREQHQPAWMLNAKYGYREGARADFFSIGVSVDIPLNRHSKQDKNVAAAIAQRDLLKAAQWQALRQLHSQTETAKQQILWLRSRQQHYAEKILPPLQQQVFVSQQAYRSDTGRFDDVVKAHLAVWSARLALLDLDIQRQREVAQFNFLQAEITE